MIGRYVTSIGAGATATFGLLLLMQVLISTGKFQVETLIDRNWILDYVRAQEDTLPAQPIEKLPKPDEVQPQPKRRSHTYTPTGSGTTSIKDPFHSTIRVPKPVLGTSLMEGEALPIVKVQPIYPRRALAGGIEGDVIVEFTITETGSVRDVIVVESSNTMFNKNAVQAANKFRYKPRVIDGGPVEVSGVRNRISFRIEK